MRSIIMAAALLGSGAAGASEIGGTWHYLRSNRDGSEPEHIYVHRAAPDRVAVYKMRARCTNAALVTATIDPATGTATRLEAATLRPGAIGSRYAVMTYDPATRRIAAVIERADPPLHASAIVTETPWHLYDYDLATLSMATQAMAKQAMANRQRGFGFGLALVWIDSARPADYLHWLGKADARFVRTERHLGHRTLRYQVDGTAFGPAGGGPLWIDSRSGAIVDVQWGRPNHAEYRDFRLRLIGKVPGGTAGWTRLLTRHFTGCTARR